MESPEIRRRTMQAVKSKDTSPELCVRRLLHSLGFRYSLHRKDLPGCPDLVFRSRKKVILVHGCFWHGHECPRGARVPKSNIEYWIDKVKRNRQRDSLAKRQLTAAGWGVLVVWECQLKDRAPLSKMLRRFLS